MQFVVAYSFDCTSSSDANGSLSLSRSRASRAGLATEGGDAGDALRSTAATTASTTSRSYSACGALSMTSRSVMLLSAVAGRWSPMR